MLNYEFRKSEKIYLFATALALILITFATKYYGSTDIGDYTDVGLYLAGEYQGDIRGSHSFLYGAMHAPFLKVLEGLWLFKLTSLFALFGIIYSVYLISNRNKNALWLALLSPVVWYMAPWANPLQLASLLLLWAWFFIKKFEEERSLRFVVYSGLLIGLGWAIWDSILFFGILLTLPFMFDKKLWENCLLVVSVFVGLLPRLILDQALFGFPFYTIMKSFLGTLANFSGGIYERASGHTGASIILIILSLLVIPSLFWRKLANKDFLIKEARTLVFLAISGILLLTNLQIRYLVVLVPIIIVLCSENIDIKRIKTALIISVVVSLIFVVPYIVQIGYNIDNKPFGVEISYIAGKFSSGQGVSIERGNVQSEIRKSLIDVSNKYPGELFVVGNAPDDYALLAGLSSNLNISKFVSIQDYEMWVRNESTFYSKRFAPTPRINDRRQIWLEGGMDRSLKEDWSYSSIKYALGVEVPAELEGFNVSEKIGRIYLSEKK